MKQNENIPLVCVSELSWCHCVWGITWTLTHTAPHVKSEHVKLICESCSSNSAWVRWLQRSGKQDILHLSVKTRPAGTFRNERKRKKKILSQILLFYCLIYFHFPEQEIWLELMKVEKILFSVVFGGTRIWLGDLQHQEVVSGFSPICTGIIADVKCGCYF